MQNGLWVFICGLDTMTNGWLSSLRSDCIIHNQGELAHSLSCDER